MIRRMFHEEPIRTQWTIWFDDDSFVTRADWLPNLALAMEAGPEVDMWGQHFLWASESLLWNSFGDAPWYRGVPFQGGEASGRVKIDFIAGGLLADLGRDGSMPSIGRTRKLSITRTTTCSGRRCVRTAQGFAVIPPGW